MLRFSKIIAALLFVSWTAPGIAFAERSNSGPVVASDGSLRYPYGKAQPTLTCRPLYVCDIALQSGEAILDLAIGDSVRWIISPAQSGPNGAVRRTYSLNRRNWIWMQFRYYDYAARILFAACIVFIYGNYAHRLLLSGR